MIPLVRAATLVLSVSAALILALVFVVSRTAGGVLTPTAGWLAVALLALGLWALTAAVLAGWIRSLSSQRTAAGAVRSLAAGDEHRARRMLGTSRGELFSGLRDLIGAAERLRLSAAEDQAALSRVLDALGEGVLAIDERRRIARVNDAVLELFNVEDRESCIGRPFIEIVRNQALAQAFDRAMGSGHEVRTQALVDSHGDPRQIELRVFPVTGSPVIAAVALFINVTQLEKLQRIRRDFIADFSHEVRTPLAGLRLALESLEGGDLRPDQTEHLFRIVGRQIYRLERLVNDLSELNEIESGEAVLQQQRIDLHQLLVDLRDEFLEKASAHQLEIGIEGSPAFVSADPVKIQQVFSNLIDNAIKHSGSVRRIDLSVSPEGGAAVVRVRDYGAGIPAEEQPKIFHRFYRVDKSRSASRGEGSGLGLAIAKHLVLRHRGRIGVESQPGEGATFWVALPLDVQAPEA